MTSPSPMAPPAASAPRIERALLGVATLLAAALVWLAPRPPMVDLPQHAGQVAIWRDMILGASPFAGELRINLATPYLVGYGLALPLAFLVPATDAIRIVLSAAILAFVFAGRALRRETGADPRLDWLNLFGVTGFAWAWGFYTFIVAAPVLLVVLRLALRHARAPSPRASLALFVGGAALLLCHGLMFLFALLAGGLLGLDAWRREGFRAALRRAPPYLALVVALVLFMVARRMLVGPEPNDGVVFGDAIWLRPITTLMHVWTAAPDGAGLAVALSCVGLAAPWLMGLRPAARGGAILFAAICLVLAFAPDYAMGTGFLQQRFALLFLPLYALMFRRVDEASAPLATPAHVALILAAFAGLGAQAWRIVAFARESQDYATVAAAMRPNTRALSLIFDPASEAAGHRAMYLHWPAWHQAERRGFVDFNFARFHPQVVRFRPEATPPVDETSGWRPQDFDWAGWRGARYDYFVLRGDAASLDAFRAKAPCPLAPGARAGAWTLIENACRN
ncbi:MAG: hypothetical protein IPL88_06395 [Rhizobiales bacterium]|nr:hypothetical protein [Hyphomicrobiales bacterium]